MTGEEALGAASACGHQLAPLADARVAAWGWARVQESHCTQCGAGLIIYKDRVVPWATDAALSAPCRIRSLAARRSGGQREGSLPW